MADRVDPERTNPGIPNTQQRILKIGSESPLLARTLLTADSLLKSNFLAEIDIEKAKEAALAVTRDVSAMQTSFEQLLREHREVEEHLANAKLKPGFAIPTIDNLEAETKAFIQRADHATAAMLDIARLFYGKAVKHADALQQVVQSEYVEDEAFLRFLADAVPNLKRIRAFRNAVEHPKPQERVVLLNFQLATKGTVATPSIELIHPEWPFDAVPILTFMEQTTDVVTQIFESLMAFMCDRRAAFDKFPISVGELPLASRHNEKVRFGYMVQVGEQFVPMSSG